METIRTLHVNTEPTWRGGEQQTLYLVEGLRKRGYPVTLCAQEGAPLADRARPSGAEVVALRMRGELDPPAIWRLARLFRRVRPHVVHCHTSHAHLLVCLAARLLRRASRPQTVLSRRVDFSIYRHSFLGLNGMKYRMVDHIVAISDVIRRVLLADGIAPERIDVIPSGVDPARFSGVKPCDLRGDFGLSPGTQIILNVAHFADHKGQRYLVKAAPRVLEEFPDCAFFIVGEGKLRGPLIELAREIGVRDRVFFPGFRTDVPEILQAADFYIMPSHKEGLGTAVLDALCCKLPVIAADAGGLPEIIQHEENGLLVEPRSAAAVAAAILRLLRNPEEAARYSAAGPETIARRFNVDCMVEGNLAVYRRLLGSRAG